MTTIYLWGFTFGTFKFLISHWTVFGMASALDLNVGFFDIFIPTTIGAITSMSIFYFSSEFLMERANAKRTAAFEKALATGKPYKHKKKFTRVNKLMVKLKASVGIYGITLLGPLFLSIPIGSIVCAKFYGTEKRTFPLMVLFMSSYSFVMCTLIYLIN